MIPNFKPSQTVKTHSIIKKTKTMSTKNTKSMIFPTNRVFLPCTDTIWSLFFWLIGISAIIMFKTMLNLDTFWTSNISKDIRNYYPLFFTCGSFSAILYYEFINRAISIQNQFRILPILQPLSLCLTVIIAKYIPETHETLKISLFLICNFLQGVLMKV